MFNVRLGWWLGNPRARYTWRYSSPRIGLTYMLGELFGITSTSSNYVSLSDGGHFENLGIYELVRRRCRYIIVGDAEQDGDFTFGGLGAPYGAAGPTSVWRSTSTSRRLAGIHKRGAVRSIAPSPHTYPEPSAAAGPPDAARINRRKGRRLKSAT